MRSSATARAFTIADGHACLPGNVRIVHLPPYGPEPNSAGKLRDIVRDGICNRVFPTLADLQLAPDAKRRACWVDSRQVLSVPGSAWLLSQTNPYAPYVLPA